MSLLPILLDPNGGSGSGSPPNGGSGSPRNEILEFVRNTSVNARIRQIRKDRDIGLSILAAALSTSVPTMSRGLKESAPDIELASALRLFDELGVHDIDAWGFIHIAEITRSLTSLNLERLPDDDRTNIQNAIDALQDGRDPEELLLDLRKISGWSVDGAKYAAAVCLLHVPSPRTEALAMWFLGCVYHDHERFSAAGTAYDASERKGLPERQNLWTACSRAQMVQEKGNYARAWSDFVGLRKLFPKRIKEDQMALLFICLFMTIANVHGFKGWLTDDEEVSTMLRDLKDAETAIITFEGDPNPAKRRTWWLHLLRGYRTYIHAQRDVAADITELCVAINALEMMVNDFFRMSTTVRERAADQLAHLYIVNAHVLALRGEHSEAKKSFLNGEKMAKQQNNHFVIDFANRVRPLIPLLVMAAVWLATMGHALAANSCGKPL